MTSPELPTGRPVPDTDDLRLLAEIVNHGAIGLPQAAWNARMSQAEAAVRLVQMAERNMPLRLVAEGDRQALWRITQAGPATGGVQLGGQQQPPQGAPAQRPEPQRPEPQRPEPQRPEPQRPEPQRPEPERPEPQHPSGPVPAAALPDAGPPAAPAPQNPLTGAQPAVQGGYPPGGPGAGTGYPPQGTFPPVAPAMPVGGPVPPGGPGALIAPGPVVLPPTSAVPPHEQAIAGAVPLGQPPFGTPPLEPAGAVQAEPLLAGPSADTSEAPGAEVPPEPVGVTPVESALPEVQPHGAAAETEATAADRSAPEVAPAAAASTWGIPGSSDWARGDQPAAEGPGGAEVPAAAAPEPEATQAWSPEHDTDDVSDNQIAKDAALTGGAAAGSTAAPNPAEEWQAAQVGRDAPVADPGDGEVAAESVVANPAETWQATQVAKDATPAVTGFEQDRPPATPDDGQNQIAKDAALAGTFTAVSSYEAGPEPADAEPEPEPAPPQVYAASPPQVQWQTTTGLSGEQLWVTLLEVIDPGDQVLTQAGYRLEQGERAVLVRTAMANHGPAPHDSLPDHYLVLQSASGAILPKAPMGVGSHPAYRVGVPAGGQADGWTVFLVPADTVVTTVIWSVRPDLVDRTLTWRV